MWITIGLGIVALLAIGGLIFANYVAKHSEFINPDLSGFSVSKVRLFLRLFL